MVLLCCLSRRWWPLPVLRRHCWWDPRLTPEFRWAQRKGDVYITMNVANVRPEQTTARITDDGHVYWRGYGGVLGDEREYVLDIRLLKPIKTAESSIKLSSRLVYFKIRKAESGPYWDRLLADESRNVHCKIDWDAWKDEDEEDDYDFGTWLPVWGLRQGRRGGLRVGPCLAGVVGEGSHGLLAYLEPALLPLTGGGCACIRLGSGTHLFCRIACGALICCCSWGTPSLFFRLEQDPTGATRILPTWTLATAMRTAAIVGRRTSSGPRDRGLRRDFFPLWSARHAAFAGPWWATGGRLVCCVSGLWLALSGGMKVSSGFRGRTEQSQGTLFF